MNEQWLSLIAEVGFPIAVTFYLLHRIETKLNTLIEAITILSDRITPSKVDYTDKQIS